MEKEPKIAVLILGYNDESNLEEAIGTALNQTYQNFEVIYIDNASTDASLSLVKSKFPNLKTIEFRKNLGYAGAYAKVLQTTFEKDFEAAILLNSDVIVDQDWLSELVKTAFSMDQIAIAQPKIFLHGENKHLANTFGNKINYLGFGFCGHYKLPDSNEFRTDREIVSASGASLLIKKSAFERIGNIDEKFFAYLEDQDLSWRAQLQGLKIMLSVNSHMWHKYIYNSNQRNAWKFFTLERNRLYFIFKNYSSKLLFLISPMFCIMEAGVLIDSIFNGYFGAKIRAYFAFLKNFNKIYQDRQIIQKSRKMTDRELFEKLNPTIDFKEINSPMLHLANLILETYHKIIKILI
jgi:GT2 family glycosyltransferase